MKSFKAIFLITVVFVFNSFYVKADHMLGADITYKNKGSNKYLITIKMYRDCRSIPISPPGSQIFCVSTNSVVANFTPSEIWVRDITPVCARVGKPCSPQNTTAGAGIEEHTYTYTYDFTSIVKGGCCQVLIGTGQCCRSKEITTGASGEHFLVSASINLCLEKVNNSPVFKTEPQMIFYCNQSIYASMEAQDTIDNDMLVYELVDPMQDWTVKTTWKADKNSKIPFTVYCAGPCVPSLPSAQPPSGLYLNPSTGDLIFTPTDCSEITNFAIRVSEYRKDSSGNYINTGYIIRDQVARVISIANMPPRPIITLLGKTLSSSYSSSNQWYNGSNKITGATSQNYTPLKTGVYRVAYLDSTICVPVMSDAVSFTNAVYRIKFPGLKIYPNPANDYLMIETGEPDKFQISLIDVTGKLINEETFTGDRFEWRLRPAKGIYYLKIIDKKGETQNVPVVFK